MEVDIVVAFHNTYRDISTFERRNDVKVPKDIVAMLTRDPVNRFLTTQRPLSGEPYSTMQMEDNISTARQKTLPAEVKPQQSAAVLQLREKFRSAGEPLYKYLQEHPSRGITTGYNEAFIVGRATRDALIAEHPSSADVLKPFLMARDIQRWRAKPTDESRREAQDKWLIFAHQENRHQCLSSDQEILGNTVTRWKKDQGNRNGMSSKRLQRIRFGSRSRSVSMQIWQVKPHLLLMMRGTM